MLYILSLDCEPSEGNAPMTFLAHSIGPGQKERKEKKRKEKKRKKERKKERKNNQKKQRLLRYALNLQ